MTNIKNLTEVDELSAGDLVPIYTTSNGATRKASASAFVNAIGDSYVDQAEAQANAATLTVSAFQNLVYPGVYALDPTTRPNGSAVQEGDRAVVLVGGLPTEKLRSGGLWIVPNVGAANLAAPSGSSLVGFLQAGTGAVSRDVQDELRDTITTRQFGAVGDGATDDTVNVQKALDALQAGQRLEFIGNILINGTLYASNKTDVVLDFSKGTLIQSGSTGFSLFVHGGTITRNPAVWATELLEIPYEGTTPCSGVKVRNFKARSNTSRKATQVCFFFADDCEFDGKVSNSNGNGVEFRQCVNPKFGKVTLDDFNAYGLFVYQCHGLTGDTLKAKSGGRVYEIKQRHKFFGTLDHHIAHVIAHDMIGFDDPAWCTGGQSYNDLVTAGASAPAIANRNFTGHEISRVVTIGSHDLTVTGSASGSVSNPSVQIGTFADGWRFPDISLEANGKDITTQPLGIGSRGDTTLGIANGATFGQNHVVTNVRFSNFVAVPGNENSLIYYGVSASVIGATYNGCNVARILLQNLPAVLPFGGQVGYFEMRNHVGSITMPLGPTFERGVRVSAETQRFISGGNNISVTPINSSGADAICNPWYVKAPYWQVIGRDEITVLANAAATNHTTTYAFYNEALAGDVNVKATVTAPTAVRALGFANASATKALTLRPSEFVMTGAPSGEKSAIVTNAEISILGGNIFTGGFVNTVSDSTAGVKAGSQNIRRRVMLSAAPTAGAWSVGDVVDNVAPSLASPITRWQCTGSGTPGTWNAAAWTTFKGTTAQRPTLLTTGAGVQFLDTTLVAAGKPIWWTGTAWVDATGAAV